MLAPPPRLLLFGAGDDTRPICAYASDVGFRVTVVDHREAFLSADRFPGAARRALLRPEDGAGALPVGPRTYAVVMSHSFAHDREWARHLLAAGAPHVGLLGPRARTEEILRQIGAEGDERVFGPVGLDLGAEGPEQVALAVVAELLAAHTAREPAHLRQKRGSHPCDLSRAAAVAGVVLAAGSSTRMGRNKLLLRLDGESLVRRAARRALAAGLDPVVVVLGHEADLAAAELAGLAVRTVVNPDHAGGIHTSRVAGLAAVPPEAGAAVVLLADMPFVTAGDARGARRPAPRVGRAARRLRIRGSAGAPDALRPRALPGALGR